MKPRMELPVGISKLTLPGQEFAEYWRRRLAQPYSAASSSKPQAEPPKSKPYRQGGRLRRPGDKPRLAKCG